MGASSQHGFVARTMVTIQHYKYFSDVQQIVISSKRTRALYLDSRVMCVYVCVQREYSQWTVILIRVCVLERAFRC